MGGGFFPMVAYEWPGIGYHRIWPVRVVIRWRMKLLAALKQSSEVTAQRSAVEVAEQEERVAELCQEPCLLLSA